MVKRISSPEQLNLVFHALADATRRQILERLTSSECSMGELAKPFKMSLPAITKHVTVLVKAGLVAKRKQGKFVHCQLQPQQLDLASKWISRQKEYWDVQLASFEKFVEQKHSTSTQKKRKNKEK